MNEIISMVLVSLGAITLLAVLLPPVLCLLYSKTLWETPPFSWLIRWWDYWLKRSL